MKVALAQLNIHVGNFAANTAKIIAAIKTAEAQGADIVVCSELSVCGYPSRDFLEFTDYIEQCEQAVKEIASQCMNIAAIVGAPSRNPKKEGKDLHNSSWFLTGGKVQHIIHKTLLPTYDIFDEYRYFEPNTVFEIVHYKELKLAITICEDIWNVGNDNPLYPTCPMDELAKLKPDLIINLSASPYSYVQQQERMHVIQANCLRYELPMVYVNQVGAQTEIIFDGGSVVMNGKGEVLAQLKQWEEEVKVVDLNKDRIFPSRISMIPNATFEWSAAQCESVYQALVLGVKDYFTKLGFTKAVLGLSGGIDSALVLCIAVEALGKKNVLPVLLPSGYSTGHSVADALQLVKHLGTGHEIIPIEENYQAYLNVLQPLFLHLPFNVAEENLQARVRGTLLMALSNKFGYILLNTTNKSEAAVGYGTLYGDMCGGLAVIGDVYKTQVYQLCDYINRTTTIIPQNIIDKAPSAELRPDQKDSDSLPDYAVLDALLYQYIEQRKGPKELLAMGFERQLVDRVLKMVNGSEWKRYQAPPILRISPKAFGMGRRMPIEGKYLN